MMGAWLKELDDLLRGRKTEPALLAEGTGHLSIRHLLIACILLALIYGAFMGVYALLNRTPPCWQQFAASMAKVPALFLLTLVVTFPSLYVFSALLNARLSLAGTLRIVLASVVITTAILASLGPITGFFSLTTSSYPFIKLLNVAFFAAAGIIGLFILVTILRRLETAGATAAPPSADSKPVAVPGQDSFPAQAPAAPPPPVSPRIERSAHEDRANRVFRVWLILYALVGAQMAWVLRPFIGAPGQPFSLFRERQSNIFVEVLRTLGELLGN
jgi:hypothetical protein